MIPGQEYCMRCNKYDGPELCLCEVCLEDFYNEYDREGQDIKRENAHLRAALESIAADGCFGERPGNVSCDAPEIVKRCFPCRARAALNKQGSDDQS